MTVKISICILTYNRCNSLVALLDDIYSLIDEQTEILVIDNHSMDSTPDLIPQKYGCVRYFRTDQNVGASGRNLAFKNAKGEIIVCLDDDVFGITKQALTVIYDKFERDKKLGALNFQVVDAIDGKLCNWVHHCKQELFQYKEFLTYEITEGAVAFRKDVLDKSGYYDPIFFISHEGPDLAFRILKSGYDCIYSGDIVVRHCHENAGRVSWLNYYYDTRNHIFIAVKNFPILLAIKYLCIGLLSMMVYSLRDGFFVYWCKAVRDGIKQLPSLLKKRDRLPYYVINIMRQIDENREPFFTKLKTRLLKRGARL